VKPKFPADGPCTCIKYDKLKFASHQWSKQVYKRLLTRTSDLGSRQLIMQFGTRPQQIGKRNAYAIAKQTHSPGFVFNADLSLRILRLDMPKMSFQPMSEN
jgi:hypothetical protein